MLKSKQGFWQELRTVKISTITCNIPGTDVVQWKGATLAELCSQREIRFCEVTHSSEIGLSVLFLILRTIKTKGVFPHNTSSYEQGIFNRKPTMVPPEFFTINSKQKEESVLTFEEALTKTWKRGITFTDDQFSHRTKPEKVPVV